MPAGGSGQRPQRAGFASFSLSSFGTGAPFCGMGRSIDRCVRSQSQSCLRSRQSWLMGSIEIRGVKRRSARGKRGWTCRTPRSLVRVSRPKGAPAARSLHAYMCARAVYLLARQRVSALDVPARSIDTSQIPCNLFKTGCLSLVVGYAALDPPSRKPSPHSPKGRRGEGPST